MKFSAILLSLTLPIAAQSAAQAQGPTPDTANFLKSSLGNSTAPSEKKKSKLQLSTSKLEAPSLVTSNGVKLRPFVPNRKLPRQRDLDYALISQTARMAQPPAPLSGQISEFGNQPVVQPYAVDNSYNSSIATYDAATLARISSPRAVPGMSATIPGQVRVNRQTRGKLQKRQFAAPGGLNTATSMNPEWFGQAQSGERVMRQGGALLAPVMAPSADRMAELGYPSAAEIAAPMPAGVANTEIVRPAGIQSMGAPSPEAQGPSAGPAPFPLSLLPQDQLKQLIAGRKQNRVQAPQAYFGSWHGGSHLPAAGFHSNIQSRGFSAPPVAHHDRPNTLASKPPVAQRPAVPQAQFRRSQPAALQVATYPPYAIQPLQPIQ